MAVLQHLEDDAFGLGSDARNLLKLAAGSTQRFHELVHPEDRRRGAAISPFALF
jgi:hypothetical protein